MYLAERGALEGVDAAMMVHPAGLDLLRMDVIAVHQFYADYHGMPPMPPPSRTRAATPSTPPCSATTPWRPYASTSGLTSGSTAIFTHGGDKPNIVPKFAQAYWFVRSPCFARSPTLEPRVLACIEAGAAAAGCTCEIRWNDPAYADLLDNGPMVAAYTANAPRSRGAISPTRPPPGCRWSAPPTWGTSATWSRRSTR